MADNGNQSCTVVDKYNFVYFVLIMIGIGSLLPYNVFINATSYFYYKLRPVSAGNGETGKDYLQNEFESYFVTCATVAILTISLGNTILVRYIGQTFRMIGALVGIMIAFIPSITFVKLDTDSWQLEFFVLTLINLVVLKLLTGVLQSGLMGLAATLPHKYTEAAMSGQALSGVLASLLQILCLALLPKSYEDSALLYFSMALVFNIFLILVYVALRKNAFFKNAVQYIPCDVDQTSNQTSDVSVMKQTLMLFRQTLPVGVSLSAIFVVTLAIFPNFTSQIESVGKHSKFSRSVYWIPVTCFLFYNFFDFIGRFTAGILQLPSKPGTIAIWCFARFLFFVIYLFTNYQPRRNGLPVFFISDAFVFIFNTLLAFSNGYFATICMMHGTRGVKPELMEQAGTVLTFYLCLGLVIGSGLSFVYIKIP